MLGAWIVLRRLAFFSHAVGLRHLPGARRRRRLRRQPDARRGSPSRSATRAASSGPAAPGASPATATALLLVAALAAGVIVLASDVFESGAAVDRLLFGTLLGLDTVDLALSAAAAALAARRHARARAAPGRRWPSTRTARRALGSAGRARRLPAARARGGGGRRRDPGGRRAARHGDLRAARGVRPPAGRQRVRGLIAWALALGPGRGRGRPLPRLLARRAAGPAGRGARRGHRASRCSRAVDGRRDERAVRVRGPRRRLRRRRRAPRGRASPPSPGARSACSVPTAAARPRSSASSSASSSRCRGAFAWPGRPAYVAQTERTRLDFPVTALDVALMGTLARGRWWLPPAAATSARPRGGARASGPGGGRRHASASSPAASASARCSPGRWCRTPGCCCSTSRSPGVDPASATLIAGVFDELRAEGRTLLVSSHDVESARTLRPRALPARRQVAFGPPAEVLDRADARGHLRPRDDRARGGRPARAVTVQHHEHGHGGD